MADYDPTGAIYKGFQMGMSLREMKERKETLGLAKKADIRAEKGLEITQEQNVRAREAHTLSMSINKFAIATAGLPAMLNNPNVAKNYLQQLSEKNKGTSLEDIYKSMAEATDNTGDLEALKKLSNLNFKLYKALKENKVDEALNATAQIDAINVQHPRLKESITNNMSQIRNVLGVEDERAIERKKQIHSAQVVHWRNIYKYQTIANPTEEEKQEAAQSMLFLKKLPKGSLDITAQEKVQKEFIKAPAAPEAKLWSASGKEPIPVDMNDMQAIKKAISEGYRPSPGTQNAAKFLIVAGQAAGIDPQKIQQGTLSEEEAKLLGTKYKEMFGTENALMMLLQMFGGTGLGAGGMGFEGEAAPIK